MEKLMATLHNPEDLCLCASCSMILCIIIYVNKCVGIWGLLKVYIFSEPLQLCFNPGSSSCLTVTSNEPEAQHIECAKWWCVMMCPHGNLLITDFAKATYFNLFLMSTQPVKVDGCPPTAWVCSRFLPIKREFFPCHWHKEFAHGGMLISVKKQIF